YYITGAPGVAQRAISVASSQDASAVLSAFEVTASSNPSLVGTYMAGTAAFGPQTYSVTGDVVVAAPYQACSALTNAAAVSGKIALVQRGGCTFKTKALQAQNAGAIGVLMVNNVAGFPPSMADDATITTPITIPMMSARDVDGAAIKTVLDASGTVTVKLDNTLTFVAYDPTLVDKVSSFTSRGIARGGNYLKPDVAAPGDTIYSAAVGTGNRGVSFSGTSMAAPHVAGVMAILRQQRPIWTVAELKALVMNTATDDVMNAAGTLPNTPSRVGAGRVNVYRATQSEVIAYNTDNPELVSVPFGVVKVVETTTGPDQTLTKTITVTNKGASAETYNVAFVSRYVSNSGISFSLLDASNNPLTSVTVPAGGSATIKVKVELNASALTKTLDPTVLTGTRSTMGEAGGFVQLTSTGSAPTLRVPVHIAARAASAMDVQETSLVIPSAGTGTVALTPTGTPVDLSNDFSLAYVLELMEEDPPLTGLPVPTVASADLQYVGVMSNYPTVAASTARVFFGFSTYGAWDTPYSTEFDIYVDINEDNVDDYVIYNYDNGGTARNDNFVTIVYNLSTNSAVASNFLNGFNGSVNTNLFNNNVIVLPVGFTTIGLSASNPDFKFYVVTFHRESNTAVDLSDVHYYNAGSKAFSTINPAISNFPLWYDDPADSPAFNVGYNTANITTDTKGLLVLHHHNAANTAEVIPLTRPTVVSITRASANPTNAASVDFTVTFSEAVSGVDASDFSLTTTGITGAGVSSVGGSGATYTVTVNTGAGDGTLRLDLNASGTGIKNLADVPLVGGFTGGEVYTIDKSIPAVLSITRASSNPTSAASVNFTVTFSEAVSGVDASDFSLSTTGAISGASVTSVGGSGATYTVAVSTGTGPGTLRLDLNASGTGIQDLNGNAIASGFTSGEEYTIVGGTIPNPWVGGVQIQSNQAVVAVGRPHLGSQVASYIGSGAGSLTQYVPML
ncbi:MAG: S8 family serine peptidase, partial [Dehalococcoidia bacterium]|nr:S8 family serine peptidase [Dehalococcoidia bacterium]